MGLPARHIHQQFSLVSSLYRLVDAAAVAGGLALAVWVARLTASNFVLTGAIAIIVHYLVAEVAGMYRGWQGVSGNREAYLKLCTWGFAFMLVATIGFLTQRLEDYPRLLLVVWPLATAMFMVLGSGGLRSLQRSYWLRGLNTKPCAIVGVTDLGIQLAHNILASPELGLKLAGYYDDRPPERGPQLPPGLKQRIGGIHDLVADAKAGFIDRVYIPFPMRAEDRIRGVLSKLADTTASVYIVPDFFVFQMLHSRWTSRKMN
jgi:putative colanic acid biosynthesis UDP-glucose lipid carrier transferase